MVYLLCTFKIDGDVKYLNNFVDFNKRESGQTSCYHLTFQGKKMKDHILEIPSIEVFDAKCFNCDTTQLCSRINPAWNKDDIEVVI